VADLSIYRNLLRPVRSPDEVEAGLMQRDMAQQNLLLQRAQMQQHQEATQRKNALMGIYQSGATGSDLSKRLMQAGALDEALKVERDQRENQKLEQEAASHKATTAATHQKAAGEKFKAFSGIVQGALLAHQQGGPQAGQQAYQAGVLSLRQAGVLGDEDLQRIAPQFDPQGAMALLDYDKEMQRYVQLRGQDMTAETSRRGQDMTDARTRSEGAANRGVTMRGQNLTDARARDLNTITKADKEATRKAEANDKAVTKFSDTIQKEGIPELETAISQAESSVGRYPKGQVPGVGPIKNILPAAAMSDEGKDVRQAIAQVRNIVLNARSGAAVTDQELRRLVEEIGTGAGMSEDDLRRGLSKVRARIDRIKTNAAAGVSDDVLNTYRDRGGLNITRGQKPGGLTPAEQAELDQLRARFGKK
jgi:hypothetical protein